MNIVEVIQDQVIKGVKTLYGADVAPEQAVVSPTRKEFEGNYTVVVFPFTRAAKKKPEMIGEELGAYLVQEVPELESFNVIKGFLNLVVADTYWAQLVDDIYEQTNYGLQPRNGRKVMVEFSSPNTNKPLHLGHIRNILLGWSAYKILDAVGYDVVRVQIVNDRGIAICKSMLAWQRFADGATPGSTDTKSDHFVGDYYVRFEKEFRAEYEAWQETAAAEKVYEAEKKEELSKAAFFKAYKDKYFNQYSELGGAAKEMLRKWEANDPATRTLWERMNQWVYDGFNETYEKLGVTFDRLYYESQTYLLGKQLVDKGMDSGTFYKKEDGSVWADLEDAKLDHKTILRSDGTSLYVTQDLGTAHQRYEDFGVEKMIYVVADEQNYHFQVLFEILKRLEEPYADGLYHLSYGMVDLPSGRMKSREGTVVDADDLVAEVIEEARLNSAERDTTADLSEDQRQDIIRKIALAALKFFIIKVHPKKRMVFDPKESVDLRGQTGPYIQNAYVRIQSVIRNAGQFDLVAASSYTGLNDEERELTQLLFGFPQLIQTAANEMDPSHIAAFCYDMAKAYHKFYHEHSILSAESEAARAFRLKLSMAVSNTLRTGMDLLGIEMPERM
ncbi:arginine--tRNA ligase [Flavilitoribacter nigricans]|uniref:Arginine--tRNA ligase n=1 Tax=Flavilitoribacter nigricans (strain ATCC 23147 / DSM 23189 / NBRC 102662 / NCIMB 1420 / SS-2) TaxID=1122177 RepID=A0A2D0NGW6_FLAN2|nr:arginine--tRNA ligase [Flavilitoribacter nigricans]PHN07626.1 arginine--tRNA ligase [Flavilitoribacter nigricans DSM 23189 = NBRC 102662]